MNVNFSDFLSQEISKAFGWIVIAIFGALIILLIWIGYMLMDNRRKRAIEKV